MKVSMDFGFNGFGGFGNLDNADFFNVNTKKKESAKEVKSEKKTETKTKEKKASAGKGAKNKIKTGNFDCDVTLPVTVKARGFVTVVEGTGVMKLSEILDKLIAEGYEQLKLQNMGLIYNDTVNVVFVVDDTILASPDDMLVDLTDGKTVTVVDGQLKAEFSISDFEGMDEDQVSLSNVAERFCEINGMYKGCSLFYDESEGLAYPVLKKVLSTDAIDDEIDVIVNGNHESYGETDGASFNELLSKICGSGVDAAVYEGDNTYFVGYCHGKHKICAKKQGSVAASAVKKVEPKYAIPMDLYIVTWNMHVPLTPDMFDGADKVTESQITEAMAKTQRMFADKERKVDYFYNEATKSMSCMFISGKKGSAAMADAHTGIWKFIHTKKEYEECKAKEYYTGLYHDGNCGIKLLALPHGNFIGSFGKGLECCTIKQVAFERKLPRIGRHILDEIISYFRSDLSMEMMIRILYNKNTGEFTTIRADGRKNKASIEYDFSGYMALMCSPEIISVMEIHSHNTMPAFFSHTDNADEQYPGVFGVIGNLDRKEPSMAFRCYLDGVYGAVSVEELFE